MSPRVPKEAPRAAADPIGDASVRPGPRAVAWPGAAGEMAERVVRHAWPSASPGPIESWSEALRVSVGLCLESPAPTALLWGPELIQVYNDAFRPILGPALHPAALGRPARETWSGQWASLSPLFERAFVDGRATRAQRLPLRAGHHDLGIERYVSFACVPVRDGHGRPVGVLVHARDATRRVLQERRRDFVHALGECLRRAHAPSEMRVEACRAVGEHLHLSHACFAEFEPDLEHLVVRDAWHACGGGIAGRHRLLQWGAALADPLRRAQTVTVSDVATDPRFGEPGRGLFEQAGARAGVFVPIPGHGRPPTLLVALQRAPRTWSPGEVALLEDAAERCGEAVERARGEARLRESEARFRALADRSPDGILIDAGDHVAYANDRAAALLGADDPSQLVGRRPGGLIEAGRPGASDRSAGAGSGGAPGIAPGTATAGVSVAGRPAHARAGAPVVRRWRRLDGGTIDLETDDGPVAWEGGAAIQVLVRDAAPRRRVEAELRQRSERMALLFDIARALLSAEEPTRLLDRIYRRIADLLDLDVYVHHAASPGDGPLRLAAFGGLAPQQVALLAVLEPGALYWRRPAQDGGPLVVEALQASTDPRIELLRPIGLLAYACFPLRAGNRLLGTLSFGSRRRDRLDPGTLELIGAVSDLVAVAIERQLDREALRDGEAQLQRADRAKTEFLAMLAHELRNPMAPLRNAVALLERAERDPARDRSALAIMRRQTAQLTRLVDDLLEVSRIEQGKIELRIEPVGVADALAAAVESVQPLLDRRGQRLEATLPDPTVRLPGDAARLTQVVTNLLHNAIKYSPPEGTIVLHVDVAADHVAISVQDRGSGIEPEMLPLVFDLFQQGQRPLDRADGGLGIGLSLVRRLVELHGGGVAAFSDGPGRGARFVVTLPRA
jgi:signal transduction histidine kinase